MIDVPLDFRRGQRSPAAWMPREGFLMEGMGLNWPTRAERRLNRPTRKSRFSRSIQTPIIQCPNSRIKILVTVRSEGLAQTLGCRHLPSSVLTLGLGAAPQRSGCTLISAALVPGPGGGAPVGRLKQMQSPLLSSEHSDSEELVVLTLPSSAATKSIFLIISFVCFFISEMCPEDKASLHAHAHS